MIEKPSIELLNRIKDALGCEAVKINFEGVDYYNSGREVRDWDVVNQGKHVATVNCQFALEPWQVTINTEGLDENGLFDFVMMMFRQR